MARKAVFVVVLWLALGGLVSKSASYGVHTFRDHPDWLFSKRFLSSSIMGAGAAVGTRNLLQRDRLNLGVWYGFHEVLFPLEDALASLSLEAELTEHGRLWVETHRTAEEFQGFVLSADETSGWYRMRTDGERLSFEAAPLDGELVGPQTLEFEFTERATVLTVGDQRLEGPPAPDVSAGFGFRAGRFGVAVDDVRAVARDGRVVVDEDFSYPTGGVRAALLYAGAGLLSTLLLWLVFRRRALDWVLVAQVNALALVLGLFAFDWWGWSGQYPFGNYRPWAQVGSPRNLAVEDARQSALRVVFPERLRGHRPDGPEADPSDVRALGLNAERTEGTRAGVQIYRASGMTEDELGDGSWVAQQVQTSTAIRVLLLGSSQTWGSGATRVPDRFSAQLRARLAARLGRPVEVVNGALRGSYAEAQTKRVVGGLARARPHLTIVNLSNNDRVEPFEGAMRELLRVVAEIPSPALLLLEANTREVPDHAVAQRDLLLRKHDMLRRLGGELGVPVFDLHAAIAREEQRAPGIYWWDTVHLTSFGQARAAALVSEQAAATLRRAGVASEVSPEPAPANP